MPATDQYWRNLNTMHAVFAGSAFALFAATIWMLAADQDREWRSYQQQADELREERLKSELQTLTSGDFSQRLSDVDAQIAAAREVQERHAAEIAEKRAVVKEFEGQVESLARQSKFKNAERGVASANIDIGVRDAVSEERMAELKAAFEAQDAAARELAVQLEVAQASLNAAKSELAALTDRTAEAEAARKTLLTDRDRLMESLALIDPNDPALGDEQSWFKSAKRSFKTWPIVNGFNPEIKILQEWLPDLPVQLGMASVARFDRCRTCHVNIGDVGAGNVPTYPHGDPGEGEYAHPFSTHPNPDLFLTSNSPHPIDRFGCTICHDGDGSGTSFQNAEHTPNNPAMAHRWKEEHHWHSNHFWEYPMQPQRFAESTCIKCHHDVTELAASPTHGATAPKVVQGYNIIREYGCFGCHEINGFDGTRPIGPDLRLEPQTAEEALAIAADPNQVAGEMRKVGPSLRHIAAKTTEGFLNYWIEEPKRFRPDTRMPQFFNLTNQTDDVAHRLQPIELAGVAAYLMDRSEPLELLQPKEGYEPNAERGQESFARRGCLACHSHDGEEFAGTKATFGPNLSRIHEKVRPGQEGFHWLYTWIKEPERYHTRTKMPDLYLDPEGEGDTYVDPAADIAAFLLAGGPKEFPAPDVDQSALDELVRLFVRKTLPKEKTEEVFSNRVYPGDASTIKGDEIELARRDGDPEQISDEEWQRRQLLYIGRRTVGRYGCFGCHDTPGFETARPIGTALQDWGRKDTSKLAFEHIEEWLHHHGEPDGASTMDRAKTAIRVGVYDNMATEEDLSAAFYVESIEHHGRPGFFWQKLRQPRSYDYAKIETKGYDERLKMPKFPLSETQIDAVATFVLGLVADPPPAQYLYQPSRTLTARLEGERLITKYNCTGCHMLEMPEFTFALTEDALASKPGKAADEYQEAYDLLLRLRPPRQAEIGAKSDSGEEIVSFHGTILQRPDPDDDPEDQEYSLVSWETLQLGDDVYKPSSLFLVTGDRMIRQTSGRGGDFTEWLVPRLQENQFEGDVNKARQAAPPPLYGEGQKVQTPWLYRFLKNPEVIRYTTVLRMPRFNMDDDEAMALANYFAAVDETPFPYQSIPQQQAPVLAARQVDFSARYPEADEPFLDTSWQVLNANLCITCHSVGGRQYRVTDPKKDVHGPDLERVEKRLRPDWLQLWVYNPKWILPYTSMPVNFPNGTEKKLPELFAGNGLDQTQGVVFALLNYARLLEIHGKTPEPPAATETAPTAEAPAGAAPASDPATNN